MKKQLLILALLCGAFQSFSQTIALKTGFTSSKWSGSSDDFSNLTDAQDQKSLSSFNLGVSATFPLKIERFSINPELFFTKRGAKLLGNNFGYKTVTNSIEIPILLRYDYPATDQIGLYAFAGPSIVLGLNGNFTETDNGISSTKKINYDEYKLAKGDFGFSLGGGVSYLIGNGSLFTDIRFFGGFKDVSSDVTVTLKNRATSIAFGYRIFINKK